jgi:hypothetical protein
MTNIVTYIKPICEYSDNYKTDQNDFFYGSPKYLSSFICPLTVYLFRTENTIKPTLFLIYTTCFQITDT